MGTMSGSTVNLPEDGAVRSPNVGITTSSEQEAVCAAPPTVANARYTISSDGTAAAYECSPSFSLSGSTQLRCTSCVSGPKWTVSGTARGCNLQEQGPTCVPRPAGGASTFACIDDTTCDSLISQLGCAHDRKCHLALRAVDHSSSFLTNDAWIWSCVSSEVHTTRPQAPVGTLVSSVCPSACNLCVRESWLDVMANVNDVAQSRGEPPAPISSVEFFFGTELPEHASLGAILDDGTGFAWDRDGSGLSYGWDCDGDTIVDYSGGRRGLNRDNGLGINHFDRDGTCGTTENPGRVNWQIAVPNGEYKATVDFGESIVRTDTGGASVACEVEGELVCPGMATGETDCIFLDQPVLVTDGFFTITGTVSLCLASCCLLKVCLMHYLH
eukprot:COSAG02_NODE_2201_length_9535_cov_20.999364_2_plen_385_part_00